MNEALHAAIRNCNGSHHSIAEIAFQLLGHTFVCGLPSGKLWYCFRGSHWEEDPKGIHLRRAISTDLKQEFHKVMQPLLVNPCNKETCDRLCFIIHKLEQRGFQNTLMKEMREQFYDKEFIRHLGAR